MKFRMRTAGFVLWTILYAWTSLHADGDEHVKFDRPFTTASYNVGMTQDKEGFLWIGTWDSGLVRYDGYELRVYKAGPGSISSNTVPSVFTDSEGVLWIATLSGLDRFDKKSNTFVGYKHDHDNPNTMSSDLFNYKTRLIAEDNDGLIWIGSQDGLNSYDKKTDKFTRYMHDPDNPNSLSHNSVWAVETDKDDLVWIGTNEGLDSFDKTTRVFTHHTYDLDDPKSRGPGAVYAILEDRDGFIWVGTKENGLNRFDKTSRTFTRYRHDPDNPNSIAYDEVYIIEEDHDGNLWLCRSYSFAAAGLEKFDREKQTFTLYKYDPENPYSLEDDTVQNVFVDRSGILWATPIKGFVNKYDKKSHRFHLYRHDPGNGKSLGSNSVVTIYEDNNGDIWMGTYGGGLNKFNRETDDFTIYKHDPNNPDSISHHYVHSVVEDGENTLWISTDDGNLSIFDRKSGKVVKRYINEYTTAVAQILLEDKTNPDWLWFGTKENGLFRFEKKTGVFNQYKHDPNDPDSLSNNFVYSLFQDRDNVLWVPTLGGGLNRFDRETETFTHYKHDPDNSESISGNQVNACLIDSMGNFWVATDDGGLNRFDKNAGRFTHYGSDNGFATNAIRGMLEDGNGNLWLGSDSGLLKFNIARETVVRSYDKRDGLQENAFTNYVQSACKTRDGEMWFAGIGGVNRFYPENIKDNPWIPPVVMTSFSQGGEELDFGRAVETVKQVILPWRKNFIEFEFAALNFTLPEKNQHAYMLEGFESEWNYMGARRYGKYTNIPGGKYTLRIKGSNNDGVWNEQGAAISLTVSAPPWKRWWAYLIYVGMLMGFVLLVFQYSRMKLKRQAKELERERYMTEKLRRADKIKDEFLANTSHELRTPLHGIIGLNETLLDGVEGAVTEGQARNLTLAVQSGRRLSNLINDILDFSKMKNREIRLRIRPVDIKSISNVVLEIIQPLVNRKLVTLVNRIPGDLPLVEADENRLEQILLNIMGNAIKFTEEGEVVLSTRLEGSRVLVSVSDTGIGIPAEKQNDIFQAFEQLDGSTTREYGGAGIGLSVTRQLVELHGGEIQVESAEGKGSTFTFDLPVSDARKSEMVERKAERILQQLEAGERGAETLLADYRDSRTRVPGSGPDARALEKQWTILIVDDEPVNVQVLENQLGLNDYRTLSARDGFLALEILETETPDLILLDLMMPRMSGYDVCRKIRKTHPAVSLPIVILTAKNQMVDMLRGLESGANDYLTKPFYKEELLARVENHLRLKELNSELEKKVHERTSELKTTQEKVLALEMEKRKDAEAAAKTKSEFLSNMSHEIRTPMNAIIGLTGLALKTELNAKQFDYLRKVEGSSQALLGIINDILDLSKIEAGKLRIESIPFNLNEVLANLSNLISLKAEEKGLELLFDIDPTIPYKLVGDPLRLGQVLINLGNNAVKFTEKGQIIIKLERMKARPGHADHVGLKFSVADTGIGLTPGQIDRLFVSFTQADLSTTRKYGGSGLGLSICKQLVEMMGGEIRVESEYGRGSAFSFTAELILPSESESKTYTCPEDLNNTRVLVVDDNESARDILVNTLESFSFRADQAASGKEALDILRFAEKDNPYRLVLMDWKMPEMDGLETSERIKRDDKLGRIPAILMVTAYSREEIRKTAEAIGIEAFLVKPVAPSFLFDAIMGVFGKSDGDPSRRLRTSPEHVEGLDRIRGARILVVEDNEINQQIAVELLESEHLKVDLAGNGKEALTLLQKRSPEEPYDLVLMDVQMPVLDGYQATRRIRDDLNLEDLPVIAMTAHAMEGEKKKCFDAGMNDHIGKPIEPVKFFETLTEWITPGAREYTPSASPERGESAFVFPGDLEGIDVKYGLKLAAGNQELYLKLLKKFLKDNRDVHDRIRESVAAGDFETAATIAHSIKGVGGNLGAVDLPPICRQLEHGLQGAGMKEIEAAMDLLGPGLQTLFSSIETIVAANPRGESSDAPGRPEGPPADASALTPLFRELAACLEDNNSEAADRVEDLQTMLHGVERVELREMAEAIADWEYEEALEVLRKLARALGIDYEEE